MQCTYFLWLDTRDGESYKERKKNEQFCGKSIQPQSDATRPGAAAVSAYGTSARVHELLARATDNAV